MLPAIRTGLLAFVASAAVIAGAPKVFAADLPVAPAYYPPSYHPAIYDWSGFYGGGHVGLGLMLDQVTQLSGNVGAPGNTISLNPFGLVGGAQAGFNYEVRPWVFGFEGTFSSSNISGTSSSPGTSLVPPETVRTTSASYWYGTAAARFGYAADTLLFYGKLGAAWMRADYTEGLIPAFSSVLFSTQAISKTRIGFVTGAGIEYGLTENLSARFEYDFLDFGTRNFNYNLTASSVLAPGFPPAATGTVLMPVSERSYTHMFTVGLNYRFSWSGGSSPY
jgi:outer membrane immunogenic protein